MTNTAGTGSMGPMAGWIAAAAVVLGGIGVLYATGTLAPRGAEPVAEAPEADPTVAPTPAEDIAATPAPSPEAAPADDPEEPPRVEAPSAPVGTEDAAAPEVAETETIAETAPAAQQPVDPAPLLAPRFDVVRASPEGTTIVAGRAAPGSRVSILLDGVETDSQIADASGNFVSFLNLMPSSAPRVLTLLATREAQERLSDEEIILAPAPIPEPVRPALAQATEPAAPQGAETPAPAADDGERVAALPAPESVPTDPEQAEPPVMAEQTASQPPAVAPVETATAEPESDSAPVAPVAETPTPPASTPADDAPAAIAVLRADAQGVELIQPATPAPSATPEQIALDTIGYSPQGDVLLSGRAGQGAPIRLYLDNRPEADTLTNPDGRWRLRLSDVAPGIYTLRLDALRADGSVQSRLETPFKRESPAALAAAQEQVASAAAPVDPAPAASTVAPETTETASAEIPGAPAPEATPQPPIRVLTVQTGDTLWAISRERYGDGLLYVRVFEANRDAIRDPDLIYPGQVFTLPE